MTNTQASVAPSPSALQKTAANQDYDEIDIVDIIGFFWRARLIVAASIVTGVLIAAGTWFVKGRLEDTLTAAVGPATWSVRLGAKNGDEAALAAVPQQLSSFIKTTAGARAFYGSLVQASGKRKLKTEELVSKQIAGQGMLKSLEIRGTEMVVTLEDQGVFSQAEMKALLPDALNQMVDAFNKGFADVQAALLEESINAQLKLGETKLKALRLFDRSSALSAPLKTTVVDGLMKELSATTRPDTILFFLAAIPDTDQQKRAILAEYRKQFVAYEALQHQASTLAKSLGLESISPMVLMGPVSNLTIIPPQAPAAAPAGSRLVERLPVLLVLGAVLGAMFGTFVAMLQVFWTSNQQRLQEIFK